MNSAESRKDVEGTKVAKADADAILEAIEGTAGRESVAQCEVEKGMMKKIPWCVGDPNPLWRNEQYARETKWGGIIASPSFVEFLRFRPMSNYDGPPRPAAPRGGLPGNPANVVGGETVEYFKPIRAGDVITVRSMSPSAKKRWSKRLDRDVVIQTSEIRFYNQFDELVATHSTPVIIISDK